MTQRQDSFSPLRDVADPASRRIYDVLEAAGQRFRDRVVLIAGAGTGIGAATARRFVAEGASVVLAGRPRAMLDDVARGLPADRVLVVETDVADGDAMQTALDVCIACFNRLDVLVNNTDIRLPDRAMEEGSDTGCFSGGPNLDGVTNCMTLALPLLIEHRGCIVNNASVYGLAGDCDVAHTRAAKDAVVQLTRAMALGHGAQGVRVNAVCPSLVFTSAPPPLSKDAGQPLRRDIDRSADRSTDRRPHCPIPLGRHGEPDEVAAAIAFLASDDASFIHGVSLPIDGGSSAADASYP